MTYDHAVLGENLELSKDAAKWFTEEKERLENRQASKKVMDRIRKCLDFRFQLCAIMTSRGFFREWKEFPASVNSVRKRLKHYV